MHRTRPDVGATREGGMAEMDPWLQAATVGLLGLLIGLGFVFWGFKLFLILLPIWGFFFGFLFGAGVVTALFNDGFLATVTGWVVGFFVGILFAVLAYLFYWFAVVFIGASVGYAIGLGLLAWLGNGGGNLTGLIFGLAGAAIVAVIVVVLRVPKYLIILLTSVAGAFAAVAGLGLILNRISLSELSDGHMGAFQAVTDLNWIWPLGAIVLAVVGIVYQMRMTALDEEILMESYRNPGWPTTTTPSA
jgi:hypothetical protein